MLHAREASSVWADGMEHHRGSLGLMELRVTQAQLGGYVRAVIPLRLRG